MSVYDPLPSVAVSENRILKAGVQDSITISVSARDAEYLRSLADDNKLAVNIVDSPGAQGDRMAVIKSTDFAGVVGLPDSDSIYIQPKIPQTALLRLLQLDETEGQVDTLEQSAEIEAGTEFVDLLAELYSDELASVMRQGVARSYERVDRQEEYVRGRLDVQRQLQRSGPAATEFHCSHDELTRDTLLNRTVLHAARVLVRVVEDVQIQRRLRRQVQQLRRDITLEPIEYRQARNVELTRLTNHYEDLLRLAELVIKNTLIEDLNRGEAVSYTFLLDMPDRYQAALIAPLRDAREDFSLSTEPSLEEFLAGDFTLKPAPDYVLYQDNEPVLVLDAKWKDFSRKPDAEDLYQLIAYQQYLDVPGVLLYPDTGSESHLDSLMQVTIKNGHRLVIGRLPVTESMETVTEYRSEIIGSLDTLIETALDGNSASTG
ncbi:5-methylcytosine restriction system specificity protein McrC [Haloarcula sp. 1CSR25-25]|uniref:McrC family protein n=1 Tax=Haloarcula sp. 1CSR25-25 TaxID=2862545 RepID=UPI0028953BF4|nr:hypothetical protein [Haloarcula sp. 1CSR25-25]MDT3434668.1 McrC family protein [Haloarcula sp. 1CSR25-25]